MTLKMNIIINKSYHEYSVSGIKSEVIAVLNELGYVCGNVKLNIWINSKGRYTAKVGCVVMNETKAKRIYKRLNTASSEIIDKITNIKVDCV